MTYDLYGKESGLDAVSRVIRYILAAIDDGTFSAAERLPNEVELCAAAGVSRTPVREAVKVLETIGVLEVRRGVGTFLRTDNSVALGQLLMFQRQTEKTSPTKLYEARLMVESTAARLLAQSRNDEDIEVLRAANQRLDSLARSGTATLEELTEADLAFHYALYDLCPNELIGTLGRFVTALFAPWVKKSLARGGGARAARNHDLLIGMIELKNPGGASEAAVDRVVEEGLEYWQATLNEESERKRNDA